MQLEIRGQNLFLSPMLVNQVEQRLRFVLNRWGDWVGAVRICAFNGPRGRADQRCRIVMCLRPSGQVAIEKTAPDIATAIDLAVDRLERSLALVLKRTRETNRTRTRKEGHT